MTAELHATTTAADDIPGFWDAQTPPAALTPAELAEIHATIPGIYGGPWTAEPGTDDNGHLVWLVGYDTTSPNPGLVGTFPDYAEHLAEFTASARTNVPRLLAEVGRLRAELAKSQAAASVPA